MIFNATFNNISVISWQSVLLVEEIGELGENNVMHFGVVQLKTNVMLAIFSGRNMIK